MQICLKGLLLAWSVFLWCLHLLDPFISLCIIANMWWCDTSWQLLVLWVLQGARIWKEASLIFCSRNPAVSCPLSKMTVNEWAGHLIPWGSTLGSSDHQLLCLGLSHAPVSTVNPEHEYKALNSLRASSLVQHFTGTTKLL